MSLLVFQFYGKMCFIPTRVCLCAYMCYIMQAAGRRRIYSPNNNTLLVFRLNRYHWNSPENIFNLVDGFINLRQIPLD